jgi:hypothetical protein
MVFSKLDCQPRWRERLSELAIPALVIHGRRDPFFPVGNGKALAREIPDVIDVQGGSKRLLTEHVAFDDFDGRRCAEARRLRGASDQRSHRLAPADELSDRGRPVQARSSCDKDHLITFSLTFPVNRSQKAG